MRENDAEIEPKTSPEAEKLRHDAEERLQEQSAESETGYQTDTQRLVHELQVHQIELEMQNEELRRSRDEMEAGMEKYSDLYDFAPVGYVTLNSEGIIEEANLAAASLLGIERSSLVKRCLNIFVSSADLALFKNFLARVFQSKGREFCEVTLLKADTSLMAVRIEAAIAASGQNCRAAITDITERLRHEEDRIVLSKLESTGILAGGIAHDFNNLLTIILLDIELAQALALENKESGRPLEEAKKAAISARGLTQQLITFAQGGGPVRKPTRLTEMIRDSADAALSGSKIRCEYFLAEDLHLADVDEGQIAQVIRNIVLNAREAMTQAGFIVIRAENVVSSGQNNPSLKPGEYVRVSISDQGGGIAKEVLSKMFDPYFSTKRRGHKKGMGLGLTICHTIIQKHEGAITIESTEMGTTFHVHLPVSRSLLAEEFAVAAETHKRRGKILVMDDEEGVRQVTDVLLKRMNHSVQLVTDGRKAIEVYERAMNLGTPFDAVLLDLTIPGGMGGQETNQELLQLDPQVKAIAMSGYSNDPAILEPERHGFKGVLIKPFDSAELQTAIDRILEIGKTP